jgi:chromosome segregation ATPase
MNATTLTDSSVTEQYIEHEVQLRVLNSRNDDINRNFQTLQNQIDKLDSKIDSRFILLIGLIITSIVMPVVLHSLHLL